MIFFFHILGIVTPTDELIFFRGVGQPPTSIVFSVETMKIDDSTSMFNDCPQSLWFHSHNWQRFQGRLQS